jgi:hypothetical protein
LIAWDFDKAFWYPEPNLWSDNAPNGKNIVPNWNFVTEGCKTYPASFDDTTTTNGVVTKEQYQIHAIDCDAFLRLLRGVVYARQQALAESFIAGPFSEQSVAAKLDTWQTQIADAMAEDPLLDETSWRSSVEQLRANVPKLHDNLRLMMAGLISE